MIFVPSIVVSWVLILATKFLGFKIWLDDSVQQVPLPLKHAFAGACQLHEPFIGISIELVKFGKHPTTQCTNSGNELLDPTVSVHFILYLHRGAKPPLSD